MNLEFRTKRLPNRVALVEVEGDIDLFTSPKLRDALRQLLGDGIYYFVLNLEKVRFIDSSGLEVLAELIRKVQRYGGLVTLAGQHDYIDKLLSITGLEKYVRAFKTNEEAIKSLGASPGLNLSQR